MAKGAPYFLKDGKEHKGQMHKMPNGSLHTGKTHTSKSVTLFHLNELKGAAKKKAIKALSGKPNGGTKKATKRK
jgi:hypothetical protein